MPLNKASMVWSMALYPSVILVVIPIITRIISVTDAKKLGREL
jgi:hypothetical protein